MKLNAPTKVVFSITLVLAVIALIGHFVTIPVIGTHVFWILAVAYALLALSVVLKDL